MKPTLSSAPLAALLVLLATLPATAGDGPPVLLRHDPFRRPAPPLSPLSPRTVDPAAAAPAAWQPTLRGVLLAGAGSLANVDGQMVGIGERIEGHRLLSVSDRQAIFEKDGRRIVLDMRRPLETRP